MTEETERMYPCSRCGRPWPWPDDFCSACFYEDNRGDGQKTLFDHPTRPTIDIKNNLT